MLTGCSGLYRFSVSSLTSADSFVVFSLAFTFLAASVDSSKAFLMAEKAPGCVKKKVLSVVATPHSWF